MSPLNDQNLFWYYVTVATIFFLMIYHFLCNATNFAQISKKNISVLKANLARYYANMERNELL